MKTKTLIQLAVETILKEKIVGSEVMQQIKEVCQTKRFESLAFHDECHSSTLIMEHPYSFCTEDFEAFKQDHLESIEEVKKDENLTLIRADETTLQYSYERFIEGYGEEERQERYWLYEVPKAYPFSTDDIQEIEPQKMVMMTYWPNQGEMEYLCVYRGLDEAIKDLEVLGSLFSQAFPSAEIKINHNSWYIIQQIKVETPEKIQDFEINLKFVPFHPIKAS